MMKKIEVLLFDGLSDRPRLEVIDNDLHAFYKAIECDTIQGLSNTTLGHMYGLDIYLDDNGKIKDEKPRLVGLFVRQDTNEIVDTLVGNLLFLRHDQEGESISVEKLDLDIVRKYVTKRSLTNVPDLWSDNFGEFEASPYLLILPC